MLHVLGKKNYEQGTCLCDNLNFMQKIVFGCCCILFGIVILRKGDNAKASLHYFALFSHSVKLLIYAFMGHNLTSINSLYAWKILNLLMLYVIACYVRSNI